MNRDDRFCHLQRERCPGMPGGRGNHRGHDRRICRGLDRSSAAVFLEAVIGGLAINRLLPEQHDSSAWPVSWLKGSNAPLKQTPPASRGHLQREWISPHACRCCGRSGGLLLNRLHVGLRLILRLAVLLLHHAVALEYSPFLNDKRRGAYIAVQLSPLK